MHLHYCDYQCFTLYKNKTDVVNLMPKNSRQHNRQTISSYKIVSMCLCTPVGLRLSDIKATQLLALSIIFQTRAHKKVRKHIIIFSCSTFNITPKGKVPGREFPCERKRDLQKGHPRLILCVLNKALWLLPIHTIILLSVLFSCTQTKKPKVSFSNSLTHNNFSLSSQTFACGSPTIVNC